MLDRFAPLTAFLDGVAERFGVPACDCAVTLHGEPIYRHSAGFSDPEGKIPVSPRDTYWIYSATKLTTCVSALRLVDEGKLSLEDPVDKYLPEFGKVPVKVPFDGVEPLKTRLTVRHLMNMTGGLDYDLARPGLAAALAEDTQTTRELVKSLARDPLCFQPGTHFKYSLCHDVLGAVIEQAAGQPLEDYVAQNVTGPLGMKDTTFFPTQEQLDRLSTQYMHLDLHGNHKPMGQGNHFRFSERYASGGAGLLSTVDDYIHLATALALGGVTPEGYRLVSQEAIREMSRDQLGPVRPEFVAESPNTRGCYSYGLGVRCRVVAQGKIPVGEFGWDGAAGAYFLADPVQEIGLFYAQQVCNSFITIQYLHPELRDTLYRCLEDLL